MKVGTSGVFVLLLAMVVLALGSACASLPASSGSTTQAISDASAVTGAVASTVAAVAPAPWGQIIAGIIGAVSVIAGIVAHSAVSKNNAQQVVSAVTTGLQAASASLGAAASTPAIPMVAK